GTRGPALMDPRAVLATEREQASARVAALSRELADLGRATADEAPDDEHDPDGSGGVAVNRAQLQALLAQARSHLAEVDAAQGRVDAGSYGTCERCGAPIAAGRLEARPTARTCVGCASSR
ncbi:MAG: TraR/DksA family transcriptional regulator, partial [Actinomycetota bacterium]